MVTDSTEKLEKRVEALTLEITKLRARDADDGAAWFEAMIESLPFDVFAIGTDGRYVMQNSRCRDRFGDIVGQKPEDQRVDEATLATWLDNNRRAFAGEVVTEEVEFVIDDCKVSYYNVIAPVRVGSEIRGIIGVNIDIADRIIAEQALRDSEERYRSLVEHTWSGFFMAKPNTGRIVFANQIMCDMMGYTMQEALELTLLDLASPDQESIASRRVEARSQGQPLFPSVMMYTARRKDGSTFLAEVSSSLVTFRGEQMIQGVARDVTEREQLQQQVQQAEKMHAIGTLAGGISHDFSNLLHAIIGNVELILKKTDHDDPRYEYAREVEFLARSAGDLSRQLLTFSRGSPSHKRIIDLNTEIENLLEILSRTLGKNIQLTYELSDSLHPVAADPVQVEQVVMNLVINARDAMSQGGILRISTRNSGADRVALIVTDSGEGMPPETKEHIFEPFFTTKKPGQGTGLGLSVVYGIVEQHGGEIEVQSLPGQGSSFTILLPAAKAGEKVRDDVEVEGHIDGKETLLLVDDEQSILKVVKISLSERGYTVITADNGVRALALFEKRKDEIDLVILDVLMPRMDGWECLRRLLKIRPDIPVIMTSGYPEMENEDTPSMKGARRFMRKPYNTESLAKEIRLVLDES